MGTVININMQGAVVDREHFMALIDQRAVNALIRDVGTDGATRDLFVTRSV